MTPGASSSSAMATSFEYPSYPLVLTFRNEIPGPLKNSVPIQRVAVGLGIEMSEGSVVGSTEFVVLASCLASLLIPTCAPDFRARTRTFYYPLPLHIAAGHSVCFDSAVYAWVCWQPGEDKDGKNTWLLWMGLQRWTRLGGSSSS
jgi:hypothetical protein